LSAAEVATDRHPTHRALRGQRVAWLVAAGTAVVGALIAIMAWRYGPHASPVVVEYPMLVTGDIPAALAVAPDGAVWFTIENSSALGVVRAGQVERVPRGRESLEPLGLAVGGTGDVWFTDTMSKSIGARSPDGGIAWFQLPTGVAQFGRMAVAPDGAVWVADSWSNALVRLRDGQFTAYQASVPNANPYGVAIDSSGTVWATLQGANQLVRVGADGQTAELELPTRLAGPTDVAVDRSGVVWFLELRAGKLGRYAAGRFDEYPIPGSQAGLTSLAVAPDGSVWLSALRAGKLIRFRDGAFAEFGLPRSSARPIGVAVDGAGTVWYTDLSGWIGSFRSP
jgi:virginiamycin B lyase